MNIGIYYPRAKVGNGGVSVTVQSWANAFASAGHKVFIIYDGNESKNDGGLLFKSEIDFVPVKHLKLSTKHSIPVIPRKLLSSLNIDIMMLHSAFVLANLIFARYLSSAGISYTCSPHGAYQPNAMEKNTRLKKLWLIYERRVLSGSAGVQVTNVLEEQNLRRLGVDNTFSLYTPMNTPSKSWEKNRQQYIAWFGRYDINIKGIDLLLEQYTKVPIKNRIKLKLRGRDSVNTLDEVQKLIEDKDLSMWVEAGPGIEGEEKEQFLLNAKYFVMPSRSESLGIVLLEALGLGVPCLISEEIPLSIELRQSNLVNTFSIGDNSLAKVMLEMNNGASLGNPELRKKFVEQHFGDEICIQQYFQKCGKNNG